MHILIGLAVATVIIILWARGNLFACVFLSIPIGLLMLLMIADTGDGLKALLSAMVCAGLLAVIWVPRYWRHVVGGN